MELDGESLDIPAVVRVAREGEEVRLATRAREQTETSRRLVAEIGEEGRLAYGIKTGIGQLESTRIPEEDLRKLQLNIVRSHAAGVGAPLGEDVLRAMMVLRANGLAKGYSGVRPGVVELLCELLNRGVHPVVPRKGSVGASGDLAPLAHMSLALVGEGEAVHEGVRLPGAEALERAGLSPLRLEAKEGLALVNGTALTEAYLCLGLHDARALLKDALVAASMSFEALRASPEPYDPRLQAVRPHPGQTRVARALRQLLRDSEIIPSHKGPHKVQDAYTLRCIPQVLGACVDVLARAWETAEVEANAATDNPLLFPEDGVALNGGNFHAQPLAFALDFLAVAWTALGAFAERRIARLVDTSLSELPPFLTEESGLNSGLMLAQYTAAALASENKVLAHPASADSIPTSANQEDFVCMGPAAGEKLHRVLANVRSLLAIEYVCAAQGLEFQKPLRPGHGPRAAYERLREAIPALGDDRVISEDFAATERLLGEGALVAAAEDAVGPLELMA